MDNLTPQLKQAMRLADAADVITKQYYRSQKLKIDAKPDNTPVTQADLEVEQALSKIVTEEFNEQYLGEEGTRAGDPAAVRSWVVDPIDGTKNFMRGMPVWATLIAQVEDDEVITAYVTAPALGRRWWAAKGYGSWTQDVDGSIRKLEVSGVAKLEDAFLLLSSLFNWDEVPTGSETVISLMRDVWRERALGDFFNHMLVAEGAADACAEPNMKEWDIAAPGLIITEAGGSVWSTATPSLPASEPRTVVVSNGLLDGGLMKRLKLTKN